MTLQLSCFYLMPQNVIFLSVYLDKQVPQYKNKTKAKQQFVSKSSNLAALSLHTYSKAKYSWEAIIYFEPTF